jgi:hypothetical protein
MDFLWNFSGVKTGRPNENRDLIAGSKTGGMMPPVMWNISIRTTRPEGKSGGHVPPKCARYLGR